MIGKARQVLGELNRLDQAVYVAVATSPTPSIDEGLRRLSDAANYSRISGTVAAGLAVFGGRRGRKAALETSPVVKVKRKISKAGRAKMSAAAKKRWAAARAAGKNTL